MMKHAFTIAWGLAAVMLALALVRLALMGPAEPLETLALLGNPALVAATVSISQWTLRWAPPEAAPPWRRWSGAYYLAFAAFLTAVQIVVLCRSLDLLLPFSPQLMLRGFLAFLGLMLVVMFNRFPKLPPIPSSSAAAPDPARWAQMARLNSWVTVGVGLILVLAGVIGVSPQTAPFLSPLFTSFFVVALLAYGYWFWRWHGAR